MGIFLTLATSTLHVRPATADTAIAVVRNSAEIVIAADSFQFEQGSGRRDPNLACKIYQSGELFFSFTGIARRKVAVGGETFAYDGPEILKDSLQGANSTGIQSAMHAVAQQLRVQLEVRRLHRPKEYEEMISERALVEVYFAWIEDRVPIVSIQTVRFDPDAGDLSIRETRCPGDCTLGETNVYWVSDLIGRAVESEVIRAQGSPVELARQMLRVAISDPSHAGPPIDILRIHERGARWIQRKDECPELTPLTGCGESDWVGRDASDGRRAEQGEGSPFPVRTGSVSHG